MHYGAETFSTGQWTMRAKSKVITFNSNNSWILNNHIFILYYQDCDLRWVGAAFDGRGASSTDWLLLRRVTKDMCSSRKSPRKLRSGKSLDFSEEDEEDGRYRLIMNWNKSIKMSEYKNKTVEIINNKPMFKEDKNYLFWHPMHTFLKVPTSSSVKCAIAQLYPDTIFSPSSTCVDEPHWCCGCCCRDCDHCSHALLGGPSVVCIIVEPVPCCIHSVPT